MARLSILVIGTALAVATTPGPAFAEQLKGQDRGSSQCARKDADGNIEASGSCKTVCKDKDISTATGEDQASGYQYTCKAAVVTEGGQGGRFDWGWLGLLGLAGLLGLRGARRDDPVRPDTDIRRP
jgi:MYXO-CTERM domain-containing protein